MVGARRTARPCSAQRRAQLRSRGAGWRELQLLHVRVHSLQGGVRGGRAACAQVHAAAEEAPGLRQVRRTLLWLLQRSASTILCKSLAFPVMTSTFMF